MGWTRSSRQTEPDNGECSPTNEGTSKSVNYQSFDDAQARMARSVKSSNEDYRGFSTSINHMFADPETERVDCCALACCGVFQSDRDRYLVTGVKPPSCCKRFWVHIVLPFWIFALAMFCAVNIQDHTLRQALSTGLVLGLLGYFITQCFKGMNKRREVRMDLLWSKYEQLKSGTYKTHGDEDLSEADSSHEHPHYLMGQSSRDIRNAHSLCGCYNSDANAVEGSTIRPSFCTRFFQCYSQACCNLICGCHVQLCGMCAVAQEGREVEKFIPQRYRLIDYVTMQPMVEYYPAIYHARNDTNEAFISGPFAFWGRLSSFSRWVLSVVTVVLGLLLVWSALGLHRHFRLKNYAVFCATLLQAVVVMKIVHWRHTKDISTDALVKFFVCGFCLSTSLAVFFEIVVGLTMRLTMSILMEISGIDVVEAAGFGLGGDFIHPGFASMFQAEAANDDPSTYRDYVKAYGRDHPIVYSIYLFINAFFLAATVEETCKYFGFRMVEHPDFLSQQQLESATKTEDSQLEDKSSPTNFSLQDRSLESRGSAITIAMVAAALGFACCENLVYIFIYGSSELQVVILLARSIFPVHPIAAALQSLRVCERDLEKRRGMGLGAIILPSVLFHGVYDFLLMWVDFLYSRHGNYVDDDDDNAIDKDDESDWLSFILSFGIMIFTLWYYFRAGHLQRHRLKAMDRELSLDESRLT